MIVDRCFTFALDVPWDVRIWVETARDVCARRGVARDSPEWGERAHAVWSRVWQPREDEYILVFDPRGMADVVVDGPEFRGVRVSDPGRSFGSWDS